MTDAPIATLFLDLGGVLLTNGWDRDARRRAAERFHLDRAEMDERHHLVFDTYEEGKSSLDDYLARVVFYEPRTFSRDEFKAFMYAQSQPVPEMIRFVRDLRARHRLKVFALSNEGRELTAHRVRTFALTEFMDAFVVSCFVHVRKPDPDIYRIALNLAQTPPARIAYLDDRALFAEVARDLGIRGIHHTGLESTRAALAALGLTTADPR